MKSFLLLLIFTSLAYAEAIKIPTIPTAAGINKALASPKADCESCKEVKTKISPDQDGYLTDDASGLTWSPESIKRMGWKKANSYCKKKKDRGLKWSLPTNIEFLKAFNPSNPSTPETPMRNTHTNSRLTKIFHLKNQRLWSSDTYANGYFWDIGYTGSLFWEDPYLLDNVRCVGR